MSIRSSLVGISVGTMLVLAVAHTSSAQRMEPLAAASHTRSIETTFTPSAESQVPARSANMWGGVAGGIAGGAAGFYGGLLAGANYPNTGCVGEDCGLVRAIMGSMVGEAVGLAIGTHYGSRGRGNLAIEILTSTAIASGGLAAAFLAEGGGAPLILAAVPVLQLTALLAMEKP